MSLEVKVLTQMGEWSVKFLSFCHFPLAGCRKQLFSLHEEASLGTAVAKGEKWPQARSRKVLGVTALPIAHNVRSRPLLNTMWEKT